MSAGIVGAPDAGAGGPGDDEQPARGLTDIEEALVGDLGLSMVGALRYSFEGITNLNPSLSGQFSSPELVHAASTNDQMLVATFRLEIKEVEFRTALAMPLGPILPALDSALAARRAERSTTDQTLFKMSVEERVRLAPASRAIIKLPLIEPSTATTAMAVAVVMSMSNAVVDGSPEVTTEVTDSASQIADIDIRICSIMRAC